MYNCNVCLKELTINERFHINHVIYCREHYIETNKKETEIHTATTNIPLGNSGKQKPKEDVINNPIHYHKYNMDTITFLEEGFAPEVSRGFYLGSAVKYLQRYELKNGLEDLEKVEFYVKKLKEIKKKDPSW